METLELLGDVRRDSMEMIGEILLDPLRLVVGSAPTHWSVCIAYWIGGFMHNGEVSHPSKNLYRHPQSLSRPINHALGT